MKMMEQLQAYNPNRIFDLFLDEQLQLNQTAFLLALSQQVANVQTIISTSGTVYFWDLLYRMYRIYFLHRVNYSLPVNSSLAWASLPANVQTSLINFKYDFSKNPNLSPISSQIKASLSLFSLNSLIDVYVLKQKFNAIFDQFVDLGISTMQNAVYEDTSSSCKRNKKVKRSYDYNDETDDEQEEGSFEHYQPNRKVKRSDDDNDNIADDEQDEGAFEHYQPKKSPPSNSQDLQLRRKRANSHNGVGGGNGHHHNNNRTAKGNHSRNPKMSTKKLGSKEKRSERGEQHHNKGSTKMPNSSRVSRKLTTKKA
jgi:hypothetical protein